APSVLEKQRPSLPSRDEGRGATRSRPLPVLEAALSLRDHAAPGDNGGPPATATALAFAAASRGIHSPASAAPAYTCPGSLHGSHGLLVPARTTLTSILARSPTARQASAELANQKWARRLLPTIALWPSGTPTKALAARSGQWPSARPWARTPRPRSAPCSAACRRRPATRSR